MNNITKPLYELEAFTSAKEDLKTDGIVEING